MLFFSDVYTFFFSSAGAIYSHLILTLPKLHRAQLTIIGHLGKFTVHAFAFRKSMRVRENVMPAIQVVLGTILTRLTSMRLSMKS